MSYEERLVRRLLCCWQGRVIRDIALSQSEKLPTKGTRSPSFSNKIHVT